VNVAFSLPISSRSDVEEARRRTRAATLGLGFTPPDAEEVVLAASELATNLARYAQGGRISVECAASASGIGICLESRDDGPGIADIARAMTDGFSTGGGLGAGLASARRLMDEFEIASSPAGTRIVARKWRR
jgi:serine/threonine-protein kinase RsbT